MARDDRTATIADLKEKFENANAVLLTEYRGLTVGQLQELRRSIMANAEYKVAKNTLARIAAQQAGIEGLDDLLHGPTAVVFVSGEISEVAKALRNFSKENDALVIKGGYFEGSVLDAAQVGKLADLESREVLLAKSASVLKAALYSAAYVFTAPAVKAVRTIDALRAKEEAAA
ncbi:MAG: 50S ribosomal protein L10 [Actinomycetaceae bacterium]|nr:50S ribosomal protein L10 [Actinomycetaceae bacterium]